MSIIYKLSVDPHNHQLPVSLRGQLVEHCIGITEVRVQVPFKSEFSGLSRYSLSRASNTMFLIFVGAHLFFVAQIGLHRPLSRSLGGHENIKGGE